jgi:hypothetical protein
MIEPPLNRLGRRVPRKKAWRFWYYPWYYPLKVDCVKKAHLVKWTHRQPEGIFYGY